MSEMDEIKEVYLRLCIWHEKHELHPDHTGYRGAVRNTCVELQRAAQKLNAKVSGEMPKET